MPQDSIHEIIRRSFPKSHKVDWRRIASAEIQGKNPEEELTWKTKDAINLFSYYNHEDVQNFDYLRNFDLPPSNNLYSGPRTWANLPIVTVSSEKEANTIALNHLAMGADGILFDLKKSNQVDINTLLDNVELPYCNVSFSVTGSYDIVHHLTRFIREKKIDPSLITGAVFWEKLPKDVSTFIHACEHLSKFHALGVPVNASLPTAEISAALISGVTVMDVLSENGLDKELAWRHIALSFQTGTDFFSDICKLKALRLLWYQVAQAYGVTKYSPGDVHVHVHTSRWTIESYQPHSNMLNGTSAALAAVLGGCDSLTTVPEEEGHSTMNRVARNISSILREEGQLDKVSDPLAGAYAIDVMVDAIARQAWLEFQRNVKTS